MQKGGGATWPHFKNAKSTLPFWPSNLPFSEHHDIEKDSIVIMFDISG